MVVAGKAFMLNINQYEQKYVTVVVVFLTVITFQPYLN